MIRPWYRSRLFWVGIPGLLFLLWAWWDSGSNFSEVTVRGKGQGPMFYAETTRGTFLVGFRPGSVSLASSQWSFTSDRWGLSKYPFSPVGHFDFEPAFRFEKVTDGLGEDPASEGWVPSPGRTLPVERLLRYECQIAWWLVVLAYLLGGMLVLTCWQRIKAARFRRASNPP